MPLGTNGLPLAFSLGNGNAPRNTLRGPGFVNWDLSLSQALPLVGPHAIGVRVDFFNAFNQDNYGIPVSNMNNPTSARTRTTGASADHAGNELPVLARGSRGDGPCTVRCHSRIA